MQAANEIYLCQVSQSVSCGACCGLYNVPEASPEALTGRLRARTAKFAGIPREMDAILAFGKQETERLGGDPPMPEFHHCPYIGLIGKGKTRVGCLLHPEAEGNAGIDFRGLSHYGSFTCHTYFCPTHRGLPHGLKQCLLETLDHWYLFGLIVPEAVLLEAFYREITSRSGVDDIDPDRALGPENRPLWQTLFSLKIKWPFRAEDRPLANYFFNDPLYPKPPVDYSKTGQNGSRYDTIFRELHSAFHTPSDLADAERILDECFSALASAI